MNSIDIASTQPNIPSPTDQAFEMPETIGIDFDRLQNMVDEIERGLANVETTETAVKTL